MKSQRDRARTTESVCLRLGRRRRRVLRGTESRTGSKLPSSCQGAGPRRNTGRGEAAASGCTCSFGARHVEGMIERLQLHVATDRFLAERRGDWTWEAACDYSALALARLASRLGRPALAAPICPAATPERAPAGSRSNRLPGGWR